MRVVGVNWLGAGRARPYIVPLALTASLLLALGAMLVFYQSRAMNSDAAQRQALSIGLTIRSKTAAMARAFNTVAETYAGASFDADPQGGLDYLRKVTLEVDTTVVANEIFLLENTRPLLAFADGREAVTGLYDKYAPWVSAALEGSPELARLRGTLDADAEAGAARRFNSAADFAGVDGHAAYVVFVRPLPPGAATSRLSGEGLLVGVMRVNGRLLFELGRAAGVDGLTLATGYDRSGQHVWFDLPYFGSSRPSLMWSSPRPGDALLANVSMIMALLTALFAALVALHTRRVMADLSRSEESARHLAGQDQLSGLPNRRLFNELLDAEITAQAARGGSFALLCIDIDHFKEINDSFGHDSGDEMIISVARRISAVITSGDVAARVGGDEFAVLLRSFNGASDLEKTGRQILAAIRQPLTLSNGEVTGGLSIGAACFPAHAQDRAELMRKADAALYKAKQGGRNRFVAFDAADTDGLASARRIEEELRAALAANALTLRYLPVMSGDGRRVIGVEALAAWAHPTLGDIAPARFIPLAEERGLIVPLGQFVMRQAMIDGLAWPDLHVSLNVSPVQLRARDFVSRVRRCLAETGFEPARLELELTDGALAVDAEAAQTELTQLRAAGVSISLDNFGAGHADLANLRRLNCNKIKIARSFLADFSQLGEGAKLVRCIVQLGRSLGLTVAAQGVENEAQRQFIQALDCDELQGFLFSRPKSAEAISQMLREQNDAAAPAKQLVA